MSSQILDDEAAKKVIRQVEFYFSDSNLPRDKFLKQTISDSQDGMVNLALICSFSRMRSHLNLGTVKPDDVPEDTVQAVANTLRKSTFLKISEDGKKVGRTTELCEEVLEQLDSRTIAASPLEYEVKHEDVESFFGLFAKVNSVRLPRHVADKKVFCGTALVEFSTEEDAENVLKKQCLVYAGAELTLKPKKDYDVERASEEETVEQRYPQVEGNLRNNDKVQNNSEPNYTQGLIVAFTLKSNSSGDSSKQNDTNDATEEANDKVSDDVKNDDEKIENVIEDESGEKPCDVTEKDSEGKKDEETGLDNAKKESENGGNGESLAKEVQDKNDIITRKDLKAIFGKYGLVKMGDESGYIRFEEPTAAKKARTAAALTEEGGLIVKKCIATLDPVSVYLKKFVKPFSHQGDAEREYWSLISNQQHSHRDNKSGNRGRGGRHNNRGGRQFNGKHSRSRDNDSVSRPNKFQKA